MSCPPAPVQDRVPPFPTDDALEVMRKGALWSFLRPDSMSPQLQQRDRSFFNTRRSERQPCRGAASLRIARRGGAAWGRPVEAVLSKISDEPVAAASLGQVRLGRSSLDFVSAG